MNRLWQSLGKRKCREERGPDTDAAVISASVLKQMNENITYILSEAFVQYADKNTDAVKV